MRSHLGWAPRCWSRSSRAAILSPFAWRAYVRAGIGAREIRCVHGGELVALHERQQGGSGVSASLDTTEPLACKPGALVGSLALLAGSRARHLAVVFRWALGQVADSPRRPLGRWSMYRCSPREHSPGEAGRVARHSARSSLTSPAGLRDRRPRDGSARCSLGAAQNSSCPSEVRNGCGRA
jgi:hypothetical protein